MASNNYIYVMQDLVQDFSWWPRDRQKRDAGVSAWREDWRAGR